MTSRKGKGKGKANYIYPATSESETTKGSDMELYEADVWNWSYTDAEAKKAQQTGSKKGSRKVRTGGSSLPVDIPYKEKKDIDEDNGDVDDHYEEEGVRIPPHVYLARTREGSHSVNEGRGKTLKNRNTIWKKMGFED